MTRYALHQDLSFCRVGEYLVFLDIGSDRYFRLPSPMEQALSTYLEKGEAPGVDVSPLVARGLLVEQADASWVDRAGITPVLRSAMEVPARRERLRLLELLEIFVIVLRTRWELKHAGLKKILEELGASHSDQRTPPSVSLERRLAAAAAVYRQARLYVPVEMRCLLDSIAMATFLRRRELHSHVVFGVALDPFSAHCWVQVGDLVLNDTVGNVNSHTPIRVTRCTAISPCSTSDIRRAAIAARLSITR